MSLSGYGILYGTVVNVRPPRTSEFHWLVLVQPLDPTHPVYRVGVELARAKDDKIRIEGQWCDLASGSPPAQATARSLLKIAGSTNPPGYFTTLQDCVRAGQKAVGLDYLRSGIVPLNAFKPTLLTTPANQGNAKSQPTLDPIIAEFIKRVRPGAKVAICGTGSPTPAEVHGSAPTGFTAVANVHMNQGTRTWIRNLDRHKENGANQDGALFVLQPDGVRALFLKYANQSISTDTSGAALDTGVRDVDRALNKQKPMIQAYRNAQTQESATLAADVSSTFLDRVEATSGSAAGGFAFQEPPNQTFDDPFVADDDHLVINNPVAQAYAKGKTRAPEYIKGGTTSLVMKLADVRGQTFVDGLTEAIAFDFIGDTGATSAKTYTGERKVTEQLCKLAQTELPAFCFHVGDVVYFYGEGNYFPCQFAVPFMKYPAPIFAIPGNHDASVYDDQHTPLQAFIDVFCADEPSNSGVLGGAARTTMTQPGVYFTLDAPFVSIIGLFSGAAESVRYMSAQQIAHFFSELQRLAQLRVNGDKRAIILAVHHLPQFYATRPDVMSNGLDDACKRAGVWPDAVVVGHAHLYQRFIRTVGAQQIPYIVSGNGGYKITNGQDAQVDGKPQVSENIVKKVLGFVRATCDGQTLGFKAIDDDGNQIDKLIVDLEKKVVSH